MMFEEYLVNDYLRALLIFISLAILMRILLFVGERFVLFFTRKTKTDLDDILIGKLSGPLTFLSVLISLAISVKFLILTALYDMIISNSIYTVIVIIVARVIFLVVNIIVFSFLKVAAKKTKVKLDDTLFNMFKGILNGVIIIISLLYVLSIWGIEIGPLLAGLGIAGLAVALALQPLLSNIFSGAAVILDGSIKVGDMVYLENKNIKGRIDYIGLRSTRIRTFDNEYIIIPNNKVADSPIQNIGLPEPKSRVVIPFGVAYGSDIENVKKVVLKEIRKVKNLDKSEEPTVKFLEMADSSLNFKAFFYVESYSQRFGAIDEANTKIYNALNKNNLEIPFPQMDVHVKK